MKIVHPRCGGIDVHKKSLAACRILCGDDSEQREESRFGTYTSDLKRMAEWFAEWEVTEVAIAYASHCTSVGRCETFSTTGSLFDNLTPLALRGGFGPGSS